MNYCTKCGQSVSLKTPEGDNRQRFVCDSCAYIHYQNPRIIAGCLVTWEHKVLLCKRGIAPRIGSWTLPAGFLEVGETVAQGAARETLEEACATVQVDDLYTVFSLPHISQVYMFYRASLTDGQFAVGEESEDVALFAENEIPWSELAFPVITDTLKHFFADRPGGNYPVRSGEIVFSRDRRPKTAV